MMKMKIINDEQKMPLQKSFTTDYPDTVNYLSTENIELPPYLAGNDPIEVLNIPIRLENALKLHGYMTVGDFYSSENEKLIKIRNIGQRSLRLLIEYKERIKEQFGFLATNETSEEIKIKQIEEPEIPKNQLINKLLERCGNDRMKDVIFRRYGLLNGDKLTLEEIGESYGVTRERIRQIQEKGLRKMRHPATKSKKPLIATIENLLYENGGILTDEEADNKIPALLGISAEDGSSILDLMTDLGWIQSNKIGDFCIYSPLLDGVQLGTLTDDILNNIKKENIGITVQSIIKQSSILHSIRDSRFISKNFVLRYCQIDPRIEESGFTLESISAVADADLKIAFRSFAAYSSDKWIKLMLNILEIEQMPLHFTEITEKVNDLIGNTDKQLDVRRAHSLLIQNESFAHSGIRGMYGLTSWGLRKESTPQLVAECLKKAGFPLHWKQIFNYVSKYKDSKPGNILSILKFNRVFEETSNGIFWFCKEKC